MGILCYKERRVGRNANKMGPDLITSTIPQL